MLKVVDLAQQLPESERNALADALGAGLRDARLAPECLTDLGPHAENVAQVLAYLSRAIRELEAPRGVVVQHAT